MHNFEKLLLKCAWSPDGSRITCGSADRMVSIGSCGAAALVCFGWPGCEAGPYPAGAWVQLCCSHARYAAEQHSMRAPELIVLEHHNTWPFGMQVNVWDASSCRLLYKLPGHTGSVNSVVFHPKQPIIASGASDKTIFLGELLS